MFFQLPLDKEIEDVLREDVFRTFEFISLCSIFVRGNFMIADSTWRTIQHEVAVVCMIGACRGRFSERSSWNTFES